jgi:L-fuconolactonase
MQLRNRRRFLQSLGASTAALAFGCRLQNPPDDHADVIDCHTHFYDPTRPKGVPWPSSDNERLYRRVMPSDYKALARPHGVTGTVVVEASPWIEDNQWILDLARDEPFIVGFVGNFTPGKSAFAEHVGRFAKNPLFRGIRIHGGLASKAAESPILADLKVLAEHDLSLDVNAGTPALPVIARVASEVPALRIVINHVANVRIDGKAPPDDWLRGMREAAARSNVYCKVSGLVEGSGRNDGTAPLGLAFYRPVLDAVWEMFGPDRVIYGSNWPVSALYADFATVHGIVREYFSAKGEAAARKYFAGNAHRAYKWRDRQ